jgi:hypothetical protein
MRELIPHYSPDDGRFAEGRGGPTVSARGSAEGLTYQDEGYLTTLRRYKYPVTL